MALSLFPRNFMASIAPEINRAFSLLDEPLTRRFPSALGSIITPTRIVNPSIDISETDKNYVIEAEVPGLKKEDLSVEFLDNNIINIKGKIEKNHGSEGEAPLRTVDATGEVSSQTESANVQTTGTNGSPTFWQRERIIGSFSRQIQFPGHVDPANVKAALKDGILSVIVPKVERQGTRIHIE